MRLICLQPRLFCSLIFVCCCGSPSWSVAEEARSCDASGERCVPCMDVKFGKPRPVVDAVGCLLGIPDKLLLWDRRAKNHRVSRQTVESVSQYMVDRGIDGVTVRVNQYDPVGEWKRLVANRRIAAPWKYTFGLVRQAKYIVFPGRLFGRDEYNPFTETLSLYSDMPSLGMTEVAYARDVHRRRYPGTYAAVQTLPLVSLWHESIATDDVIDYVSIRGTPEQQEQIRRDLYARFGIVVGGELAGVLPDGSGLYVVVGSLMGHAVASIEDRFN